ncbi:N-acetyltransferase [Pseudoxanthomonas gei]|uniref:N-acetyltransferase n=1 Tax=Pseudoxanthomonas gei TaxID=1383030 RepID=A0ABX0AFY9_9GAMM|nr:GNAT family N-acetyltransferase [Pseudoxanthomonas gei]NDK39502.1 N-acetyltransferase [Pseudoxanthomonas gei]
MQVSVAQPHDIDQAVDCLTSAFSADPITRFLLQPGQEYPNRLRHFFSLLMQARVVLGMPVLLSRDASAVHGAAMGYTTSRPEWPSEVSESWEALAKAIPGFDERMSVYDCIAESYKPQAAHYYLGAIGVHPAMHGLGIGAQLLRSFCALSDYDQESAGVYLETANPANVKFYEQSGFTISGSGSIGDDTIWCMFRPR